MLLLDLPTIQPPTPGVACAWLVITPDGTRRPFLDHAEAVAYAHWQNGSVFANWCRSCRQIIRCNA